MTGPAVCRVRREGTKEGVALSPGQERLLGKGSFGVGLGRWVTPYKEGIALGSLQAPGASQASSGGPESPALAGYHVVLVRCPAQVPFKAIVKVRVTF